MMVPHDSPDAYLGPAELAARWGLEVKTIHNWVSSGRDLPRSMLLTRSTRRWRLADVEAWERDRTHETAVTHG